jgi:hypothetical protein
VLNAVKEAGLNLVAVWGYPIKGKKAILDVAAEDPKAFAKLAKKQGWDLSSKKQAFHLDGEDQPGAVAAVMGKLAGARINCHAAQAVCAGAGRFGLLIQVDSDDFKKAKKALSK